jgi:DNA-binding ferritin-like protein
MKTIKRQTPKMGALIAELLHGATKTHMAHLKTTSFSAHMALNEFYDALPDLVDAVAEQYQGATEELLDYPTVEVVPISTPENAIEYLRKLHGAITRVQDTCEYSEIINELDVIKSLIDSTKYKLIFLK